MINKQLQNYHFKHTNSHPHSIRHQPVQDLVRRSFDRLRVN